MFLFVWVEMFSFQKLSDHSLILIYKPCLQEWWKDLDQSLQPINYIKLNNINIDFSCFQSQTFLYAIRG